MIAEPSDDDRTRKTGPVTMADPKSGAGRRIRIADLMANDRHVILEHGGDDYVLRITAKGKLILTK